MGVDQGRRQLAAQAFGFHLDPVLIPHPFLYITMSVSTQPDIHTHRQTHTHTEMQEDIILNISVNTYDKRF